METVIIATIFVWFWIWEKPYNKTDTLSLAPAWPSWAGRLLVIPQAVPAATGSGTLSTGDMVGFTQMPLKVRSLSPSHRWSQSPQSPPRWP
jgi:hypothetical protein